MSVVGTRKKILLNKTTVWLAKYDDRVHQRVCYGAAETIDHGNAPTTHGHDSTNNNNNIIRILSYYYVFDFYSLSSELSDMLRALTHHTRVNYLFHKNVFKKN